MCLVAYLIATNSALPQSELEQQHEVLLAVIGDGLVAKCGGRRQHAALCPVFSPSLVRVLCAV